MPRPVHVHRCRGVGVLLGLELVTGGAALVAGLLLVAAPDGSLMQADPTVLAGSPFHDWRVPACCWRAWGRLRFLGTAVWQWIEGWRAGSYPLWRGSA